MESWAVEQVVLVLRRRYPDGMGKEELQEETGLGGGDLREVIDHVVAEGLVEIAGDAYALTEDGYEGAAVGSRTPADPPAPPELTEPAPEGTPTAGASDGPEALTEAAEALREDAAPTGDTRYEAQILVTVGFYPELAEGETEDDASVREAAVIAERASAGISGAFPSLPVASRVLLVQAFDRPRDVFRP